DALWLTLEWSWDLLDDWQQVALGQLAVFQGRFTMPTIERVVKLERAGQPMAPTALDAVQALGRHSLLESRGEKGGVKVFFLLDTVRDFARQRWQPTDEEREALHRRYCATIVGMGIEARQKSRTSAGREAMQTLRWLRPDLGAVMDSGAPLEVAQACVAVSELLIHSGER